MRKCVAIDIVLVAGLVAAGCGDDEQALPSRAPEAAEFTTRIDNSYWPMAPGTRWTYSETDQEGARQTVVVTVSDSTKRVAGGITARVVRDTVTEDGRVVEDTLDFYAQDRDGNVWYLGEDTAEFENGRISSREGSWEAGVRGGEAGIMVPAHPEPGMAYREEYLEGEAEDRGEVLSLHELAETPAGRWKGSLLIRDTTRLEPAVEELKLYAKGVGPVLALGVSGGPGSREELIRKDRANRTFTRAAGTAPLGSPPTESEP